MNYVKRENYITAHPDIEWWRKHINNEIIIRYKNYGVGNCLDIGCNHGCCTYLIAELDSIQSVVGLDLNQKALDIANTIIRNQSSLKSNFKVTFQQCNIINAILFTNIDTIYSFHMLEHLLYIDAKQFISNCYNILKPTGYFIISIPYETNHNSKEHVEFYNENKLEQLFLECGFKTETIIRDSITCLTGIFHK